MVYRHPVRLAAAACLFALALAGAAHAAPQLTSRLDVDKSWLGEQDDVFVRFTLTNEGTESARVLAWQTPLRGLEANILAVGLNGQPVAYLGRLVKRAAPTAADYITLAPGRSLSTRIELSAVYDLGLPGEYTVAYRGIAGAFATKAAGSNTISFYRDGDFARAVALRSLEAAAEPSLGSLDKAQTPSYVSCSSSRQSSIVSALNQAQTYADNGVSYLTAGTHGTRFTKWFGTYTSSHYSTITSHYNNIKNVLHNTRITLDCTCTDSYYAWVFANQPYTIHLCNAFWAAPTAGTDSKGGTLIHELSHFTVIASTDDWAYGQSACASLAISNSSRAIDNADSHEYFGENSPAGT
jgi:peptidyl-Lys metalloendopeptidase